MLGLLEYVDLLRKSGHTRLFPELSKQRDGYSQRVSKWFARYRKRCGIVERGKVFHSFRHTLANELKQKGIPLQVTEAIVGHEDKSMSYGRYGKTYQPEVLHNAINSIDYGLKHPAFKF